MAYEVTTPVFEGPFDLLLHLILREQVDLYEISLTHIVDAYLAELEAMEELNLEVATEFLLIAATLVELKTRRLLPGSTTSTSTTSWPSGPSATCSSPACVECKTFKDAADRPRAAGRGGRPLVPPGGRPRRALHRAHPRPAGGRHARTTCAGPSSGPSPRSRWSGSTSTTWPPSGRRSTTP